MSDISAEQFEKEYHEFAAMAGAEPRLPVRWEDRHACLNDRSRTTPFDTHYVYHTAWAARILAENRPEFHIDISSLLYFSTLVSAFVPVKFYDYRPARLTLSNLTSEKADLLALPFATQSVLSLSCMHVVEHIGLGRYGDPLDPDGDLKAMRELQRVLAPGGRLIFVTPVGRSRVCFNAHRVYDPALIQSSFSELTLKRFAIVPDDWHDGHLVENPPEDLMAKQQYACGCFLFERNQ